MVEEIRQGEGRLEHPEVRHEPTDVSFRPILGVLVAALVLAAIMFYVILEFFHKYEGYQAEVKRSSFPLAPAPAKPWPPDPRLEQVNRLEGIESGNVYEREAAREQVLNSLGATSGAGFVHVPIDQAMKHLANRLPARTEPAEAGQHNNGLVDAGEPNSGRLFRGRPK